MFCTLADRPPAKFLLLTVLNDSLTNALKLARDVGVWGVEDLAVFVQMKSSMKL